MNFKKFAQKYADEINGEFRDYDENQSVIVIRLEGDRFQAVQGNVYNHEKYGGREVVQLKTKVCTAAESINFSEVLASSTDNIHSKFIIEDGFLKIEASAFMDSISDSRIKEMLQEIGNLADEWELKITGKDIY
ncbi:MAG: hypothetical protein GY816_21295 [Cytophagales bacterium]|nr:hypothetical protein [Cytophagales bacterium]